MAEVRVQIDDGILEQLRDASKAKTNAQLVGEALTLFQWALAESAKDRQLLSTDSEGNNVVRLAMPSLSR